ncbi:oxidative stress survival Svf1-like protein [Peniophora sp. CONT]|nr:oxidative stress survival Svf1-like protein [Peniophora sp. CONT]
MFSSLFSTSDPTAQNFHPVSSEYKPEDVAGTLEPKDLEWTCAGGFITETQTFYSVLEDGTSLMCQIIHSAVGMWYPQIQLTFKLANPATGENTWKSINISNFVTPPPGLDKRSSKSDQITITHKDIPGGGEHPELYTITVNCGDDLKVMLDVRRPVAVPGVKVGKGPKGGYSYFGTDKASPEGYVVHRFWPLTQTTGHVVVKGVTRAVQEAPGIFIHAIQGMRPNLVAARWNFVHFKSLTHPGTTAVQMEFTTTDSYGKKGSGSGYVSVNVGVLTTDGKLAAVTAETKWPGDKAEEGTIVSRVDHLKPIIDPDTTYAAPTALLFTWKAPSLVGSGDIKAVLQVDVGEPSAPKGLIEKVDVLGEIPGAVKSIVSYVAGTKPYIYMWMNPAKLILNGSDEVDGYAYIEASYISA